jgi:hypothetical protein
VKSGNSMAWANEPAITPLANKNKAANLLSMSFSKQNIIGGPTASTGIPGQTISLQIITNVAGDIGLVSAFALLQRNPFGNGKSSYQTYQGTRGGIAVVLSRLRPDASKCGTYQQQSQRHQVYQAYPAHHRAFGNRYDDFITNTGIDRVVHLKSARFAAKQLGQLTRPAALACALFAAIGLIRLDQGMLAVGLDYYGACLEPAHLWL